MVDRPTLSGTLLGSTVGAVMRVLGQKPEVIELARPYYLGFAFAILPIVWFGVLRSFAAAMMKTAVTRSGPASPLGSAVFMLGRSRRAGPLRLRS